MAVIQLGDRKIDLPDGCSGEPLHNALKELGLPFGCEQGACGECQSVIEEGSDKLSEMTEFEVAACLPENVRRICTCKISDGLVKVRHVAWDLED